jgi:hypothetical protein
MTDFSGGPLYVRVVPLEAAAQKKAWLGKLNTKFSEREDW